MSLIKATFKITSKPIHSVMGISLDPKSYPGIYLFVQDIAKQLGSSAPDNIVVGLEPNYYVTSADVNVSGDGKNLLGETLFLSLPLSRIFTLEELKAVIGHELGHFRGHDTHYSRKFSPVYAGLIHAITDMRTKGTDSATSVIAKIPALVLLSYIIDVFHKNISTISREREFHADMAATEVAKPIALSTSLLKISLYAHAWNNLKKMTIARLEKNKATRNMSQLFSSTIKYDINKESIPEVLSNIYKETISHPTDSHPPTANRIEKIGVQVQSIDNNLLLMPSESCINLIENHIELEEKLTKIEQQYYVALGVQIPDEKKENYTPIILAAFGAHMVLADGKVKQEEIDNAESIGIALSKDFDRLDFREYCNYPETIPPIEVLINAVSEMPAEAKMAIYNYLKEIANSDKEISPEESSLLDHIKLKLLCT